MSRLKIGDEVIVQRDGHTYKGIVHTTPLIIWGCYSIWIEEFDDGILGLFSRQPSKLGDIFNIKLKFLTKSINKDKRLKELLDSDEKVV